MKNQNLYSQIAKQLKKEPQVISAYVTGSTISGYIKKESDFDLIVVVNNRKITTENRIYELIKTISFPRDLDLSVIDQSSSPIFSYHAISKGERIYEKEKSLANNFEAYVLHNYYDTSHLRKIYERYLKKEFLPHAI